MKNILHVPSSTVIASSLEWHITVHTITVTMVHHFRHKHFSFFLFFKHLVADTTLSDFIYFWFHTVNADLDPAPHQSDANLRSLKSMRIHADPNPDPQPCFARPL
jgi:hypothetical protein